MNVATTFDIEILQASQTATHVTPTSSSGLSDCFHSQVLQTVEHPHSENYFGRPIKVSCQVLRVLDTYLRSDVLFAEYLMRNHANNTCLPRLSTNIVSSNLVPDRIDCGDSKGSLGSPDTCLSVYDGMSSSKYHVGKPLLCPVS